jgi:peptide methionine sulfoxide reductase MsrA
VLQIDYDPARLGYRDLLAMFWAAHDPTRAPYSTQYQAAVLCADDEELRLAHSTGERAASTRGGTLRTRVAMLDRFHRAEDYHQKYGLRHERGLEAELIERHGSDQAMVDSTSAARINGLLGGHGSRRELVTMLPTLGLSAAGERTLLARVSAP